MTAQSNWWFQAIPPTNVPAPSPGYFAFFVSDGSDDYFAAPTVANALYKMDSTTVVTPLIPVAYTNENAQDAVGSILVDSATIDFTYDDTGNTITAIVPDGSITLAKLANLATDHLIGRDTAGTGAPESIGVTGGIEFDGSGNIRTGALTGDATKSAGGTALTLATVNSNVGSFGTATQSPTVTVNGKGLVTAASNTAIQLASSAAVTGLDTQLANKPNFLSFSGPINNTGTSLNPNIAITAQTGDVTTTTGNVATIANDAVTYAKMQNVSATNRIIGRATAGAGDPEELTPALVDQIRHMGIAATARRNNFTAGTALSSATTEIAHATIALAANQLDVGLWHFHFSGQVTNGATTTVLLTARMRVGAGTGGAIIGSGWGMSPITAINRPYSIDVYLHQITSNTAICSVHLGGGLNNAVPTTTQTENTTPVTFDVTASQTLQLTLQQAGATGYTAGAVTPALCFYSRL